MSSASYRRPGAPASLWSAGVVALLSAGALAGCATSIPLPSFISHDDVTGSIPRAATALSASLDIEDWRRASAAMAVALDPQGNGSTVKWENPQSGARGAFTPVADAYPAGDRICRALIAEIGGAAPAQQKQGVGCRDKSGDWTLGEVKPFRKA